MLNTDSRYKCDIDAGNTCPSSRRYCVDRKCMTNRDPDFRCDDNRNICRYIGGYKATCTDSRCYEVGHENGRCDARETIYNGVSSIYYRRPYCTDGLTG